jgi:hypothetical protein
METGTFTVDINCTLLKLKGYFLNYVLLPCILQCRCITNFEKKSMIKMEIIII